MFARLARHHREHHAHTEAESGSGGVQHHDGEEHGLWENIPFLCSWPDAKFARLVWYFSPSFRAFCLSAASSCAAVHRAACGCSRCGNTAIAGYRPRSVFPYARTLEDILHMSTSSSQKDVDLLRLQLVRREQELLDFLRSSFEPSPLRAEHERELCEVRRISRAIGNR